MANYLTPNIMPSSMLIDDVIAEEIPSNRQLVPEQYMLYEILVLSLRDLASPNNQLRAQAVSWFEGAEKDHFMSFENLADILGMIPQDIRKTFIEPALKGDHEAIRTISKVAKVDNANHIGI
jgi:hypothetical protein